MRVLIEMYGLDAVHVVVGGGGGERGAEWHHPPRTTLKYVIVWTLILAFHSRVPMVLDGIVRSADKEDYKS
jgi:hypothetical protein